MKVVFRRTGERRYAVTASPPGHPHVEMDPAPGYDPALPHDLVHYVVEGELGLALGVFGQLAKGGAGSFRPCRSSDEAAQADSTATSRNRAQARARRRIQRRSDQLAREGRSDGEFSERAAAICHGEWLAQSERADLRRRGAEMAHYVARVRSECSRSELEALSDETVQRICNRLDELSAQWSRLAVGEGLELQWSGHNRRRDSGRGTPSSVVLLFVSIGILLVAAGACASDAAEAPFVITDSAGAQVVRTRAVEGVSGTWRLSDPPAFRLGSEEAGSPELFGQINSLHLGPDGKLWVADLSTADLRVFFTATGEHLFTAGRRGEGPGEFLMPMPVGFEPDGRAWIWDRRQGRLTALGPGGDLVDVRTIPGDITPLVIERLSDGSLLARLPQTTTGPVTEGSTFQDTVRVWRIDAAGGAPRLLVERPGPTWFFDQGAQTPVPFALGSQFGTRDGRIVLTDPTGVPSLDIVDSGALVRRIHLERERRPVTPEALDREVESRRSEAQAEMLRRQLSEVTIPPFVPTWAWIRVSPDGRIFALHHGTLLDGEVWDVFGAQGRFEGTLSLQGPGHLMDVRGDLFAVVEYDQLGTAAVAVFRMSIP